MPRIYKYVLEPECHIGEGLLLKPLSVGWQGDDLVLWAEVSESNPALEKIIPWRANGMAVIVVPTGEEVPISAFEYVGTAHGGPPSMFTGPMVMHVYAMALRLDRQPEA